MRFDYQLTGRLSDFRILEAPLIRPMNRGISFKGAHFEIRR
jgi:hypothetical protein